MKRPEPARRTGNSWQRIRWRLSNLCGPSPATAETPSGATSSPVCWKEPVATPTCAWCFPRVSTPSAWPNTARPSCANRCDMGWFLRYVGYALVAGDPASLSVNTRGLRDILLAKCFLAATNVALQEMRAASAQLLRDRPEARQMAIDCFNVLLQELAIPTPSTRQRRQPSAAGPAAAAIYALASEGSQLFEVRPAVRRWKRPEIIRAAYRQVFERDIAKGLLQAPCGSKASQSSQGQISMREFIRTLGRSKEYRQQFHDGFVNSRVVELAYRHFLGRGISSARSSASPSPSSAIRASTASWTCWSTPVNTPRPLGRNSSLSAGISARSPRKCRLGLQSQAVQFQCPFDGAPNTSRCMRPIGSRRPARLRRRQRSSRQPVRRHLPERHRLGGHTSGALRLRQSPPAGQQRSQQPRTAKQRQLPIQPPPQSGSPRRSPAADRRVEPSMLVRNGVDNPVFATPNRAPKR